jgi:hypothetical protein
MNERPMKRSEWAWLIAEVMVLCLFLFLTFALRAFMLSYNAHYMGGAARPGLSKMVLMGGPLHLPSMIAVLIVLAVTLVALPLFLKKEGRDRYLFHAPVLCFAASLTYLSLILLGFLIPFIPIISRYCDANESRPPIPIPETAVAPWIWLYAAFVYAIAVIALIRRHRKKNGSASNPPRPPVSPVAL